MEGLSGDPGIALPPEGRTVALLGLGRRYALSMNRVKGAHRLKNHGHRPDPTCQEPAGTCQIVACVGGPRPPGPAASAAPMLARRPRGRRAVPEEGGRKEARSQPSPFRGSRRGAVHQLPVGMHGAVFAGDRRPAGPGHPEAPCRSSCPPGTPQWTPGGTTRGTECVAHLARALSVPVERSRPTFPPLTPPARSLRCIRGTDQHGDLTIPLRP